MDERDAFLAALLKRKAEDPTACRAWRVRDLVAHLTAGAREEADLIQDALAGRASRPTREFTERERAYRTLEYTALLSALAQQGQRLQEAIAALDRAGAQVNFTGAVLDAAGFRTHTRSELSLHRWDLAGDDETGHRLLEQPDLTAHAVKVLSTMHTLQESFRSRAARVAAAPDGSAFVLRSPDRPDVLVRLRPDATASILPTPTSDHPVVACTAADRLLLLWGRASERADLSDVTTAQAGPITAFLQV
ncbi:maleylpyruvate isomerase family protein [Actinomadura soli]|uniref:Maleylpyruvate isomerase family protein n=1 Tax=Actinomadura soli TaxID=2508997 RepID=A0A5C4J058_9ACTN|nr:maleylpyruvate isomerase N-terminal domain-containing protein [Actinomadura soli]TMQ89834.1 maleylpyruvate isomerase family protein [Actinomadura soli]